MSTDDAEPVHLKLVNQQQSCQQHAKNSSNISRSTLPIGSSSRGPIVSNQVKQSQNMSSSDECSDGELEIGFKADEGVGFNNVNNTDEDASDDVSTTKDAGQGEDNCKHDNHDFSCEASFTNRSITNQNGLSLKPTIEEDKSIDLINKKALTSCLNLVAVDKLNSSQVISPAKNSSQNAPSATSSQFALVGFSSLPLDNTKKNTVSLQQLIFNRNCDRNRSLSSTKSDTESQLNGSLYDGIEGVDVSLNDQPKDSLKSSIQQNGSIDDSKVEPVNGTLYDQADDQIVDRTQLKSYEGDQSIFDILEKSGCRDEKLDLQASVGSSTTDDTAQTLCTDNVSTAKKLEEDNDEKQEETSSKKVKEVNNGDDNTTEMLPALPKSSATSGTSPLSHCVVGLLNGGKFDCPIGAKTLGKEIFDKTCDYLILRERQYFSLTYVDNKGLRSWLNLDKKIVKQLRDGDNTLQFEVKFFPDPTSLNENITRYFFSLQIRNNLLSEKIHCSSEAYALLGSYLAQSELGNYDPDKHKPGYLNDFKFAPNPTSQLIEKLSDLHRQRKGLTAAEADLAYLRNAQKLSIYGLDFYPAFMQDSPILIGVCFSGLSIYKDKVCIERFYWPKILKISYNTDNFFIKIRSFDAGGEDQTICYRLPTHKAAKGLWKIVVDHHTLFKTYQAQKISSTKATDTKSSTDQSQLIQQVKVMSDRKAADVRRDEKSDKHRRQVDEYRLDDHVSSSKRDDSRKQRDSDHRDRLREYDRYMMPADQARSDEGRSKTRRENEKEQASYRDAYSNRASEHKRSDRVRETENESRKSRKSRKSKRKHRSIPREEKISHNSVEKSSRDRKNLGNSSKEQLHRQSSSSKQLTPDRKNLYPIDDIYYRSKRKHRSQSPPLPLPPPSHHRDESRYSDNYKKTRRKSPNPSEKDLLRDDRRKEKLHVLEPASVKTNEKDRRGRDIEYHPSKSDLTSSAPKQKSQHTSPSQINKKDKPKQPLRIRPDYDIFWDDEKDLSPNNENDNSIKDDYTAQSPKNSDPNKDTTTNKRLPNGNCLVERDRSPAVVHLPAAGPKTPPETEFHCPDSDPIYSSPDQSMPTPTQDESHEGLILTSPEVVGHQQDSNSIKSLTPPHSDEPGSASSLNKFDQNATAKSDDIYDPEAPLDSPEDDTQSDLPSQSDDVHPSAKSGSNLFNSSQTNGSTEKLDRAPSSPIPSTAAGKNGAPTQAANLDPTIKSVLEKFFQVAQQQINQQQQSQSNAKFKKPAPPTTVRGKTILAKPKNHANAPAIRVNLNANMEELPSSAVELQIREKYIKKLNRQERVIEEVKCVLKPFYQRKDISKNEYKDIMRKAVPKICHSKTGEINPVKIKQLVETYVAKTKHARKSRKR